MMSEGTLNGKISSFTEVIYIIGQLIGNNGVTHCGPMCYIAERNRLALEASAPSCFIPTAESSWSARSIPKGKGCYSFRLPM